MRLLRLACLFALGFLPLLYACDWMIWQIRMNRKTALGSVQVEQFLATPLKGEKVEYDFLGTITQPCVRAIFPHAATDPCWWAERHKTTWEH